MKQTKQTLFFAIGVLGTLTSLPAWAQSYSIRWWTVDGGGGASAGGVYAATGTIGQPDAGTLRGPGYALSGGFWSVFQTPSTVPAPLLDLVVINQQAILTWPNPSEAFVLQEALSLGGSALSWGNVTQAAIVNGNNQKQVSLPLQQSDRFFRLRKP